MVVRLDYGQGTLFKKNQFEFIILMIIARV